MLDQLIHGYGLCECGCGGATTIALASETKRGYVRGEPRAYLPGHWAKAVSRQLFETYAPTGLPDECWVWTGPLNDKGYGQSQNTLAHRVAYAREYGPIPVGHLVCHSCDNPPCVNPAHLFVGTHDDNMKDMVRKGRASRMRRGNVVTGEAVIAMRRRYEAGGISQDALALEYGLSQSEVSRIVLRRAWADI